MAAFIQLLDVANRALQILGVPRIANFTATKAGLETAFAIDMIRQSELKRSVWTIATRRAVLRPIVSTSVAITFVTYSSLTTYALGDVVADSNGFLWLSMQASNLALTPGTGGVNPPWTAYYGPTVAQAWDAATQYYNGDMVTVSSVIYIAAQPSLNHTPPNASYWHVVASAAGAAIGQFSPLGVSNTAATTRNIYRLPANFIRFAPQDPKAAGIARQGLTAGMPWNDWEIEAGLLYTTDTAPIILRFVADQTDVSSMGALFCEVWASQLAAEVALPLTQSVEKMNLAIGRATRWLGVAKALNAIEEGSTDPELPEGQAAPAGGQ